MSLDLRRDAEPVPGYRLIERLGRGGFGIVWKAEGPGGFKVALKFVPLAEQVGPVELRALQIIREIRHPHLLTTFGSWQSDDHLIIAMELAERTLLDRFREAVGQGFEGIPAPEIIEHFLDAAKGIDYLNKPRNPSEGGEPQGIQHRDIKPQNLLLVGGSVKVADFGLARILKHSQTGHTGSLTPLYAAPEFYDRKTSSQSDQYSLAVAYCHLRGGRLPFEGSLAEVMAGHVMRPPDLSMLPEEEREAVGRALAKAPRDRWPSCRAFVHALSSEGAAGHRVTPIAWLPSMAGSLSTPVPDTRERAVEDDREPTDAKEITNSLGMKLALIPAGDFLMGSPDSDKKAFDNEKPQHRVRITRPFYLGVYEVSQQEYETVMGRNPSWFSAQGEDKDRMAGQDTRRHPVESVLLERCDHLLQQAERARGVAAVLSFRRGGAIGR